jgi:hypothetical protein
MNERYPPGPDQASAFSSYDENWRGPGTHTGDRHSPPAVAAAPGAPSVRLLDWRPRRSGSLRGFVSVVVGRAMRVNGIAVMVGTRGPWLAMPSKPLTSQGQPMLDALGKPRHTPVIEWIDRLAERRFASAVLAALLSEYPDALGGDGF